MSLGIQRAYIWKAIFSQASDLCGQQVMSFTFVIPFNSKVSIILKKRNRLESNKHPSTGVEHNIFIYTTVNLQGKARYLAFWFFAEIVIYSHL